ncbi:hypothetical protein VD0004_g1786 [Verticillium dahliae]|nr:hypothetical protein VD0004_g1786 [Verticillium dahliae]PNH75707.1 hypothetical protein VD0001_g1881 [Verticillium dahliae]
MPLNSINGDAVPIDVSREGEGKGEGVAFTGSSGRPT